MEFKILSLTVKLNKLEKKKLSLLTNALNIENIENKENINEMIINIQNFLKKLDDNQFKKYENIILEFIKQDNNEDNSNNIANEKKIKNRKYNEILSEKEIEEKKKEDIKLLNKIAPKQFKFKRLTKEGAKYYYTDKNNLEWEFREKNGSKDNYYFVCSTAKCNAFGKISRKDSGYKFNLTQKYNISYIMHTYYDINIINDIYKNNKFEQKDWDNEEFRKSYLKWYFENYNNSDETTCYEYLKSNFNNKIQLMENIITEIKKTRLAFIMKNRSKANIIDQLLNLKDDKGDIIIKDYIYEYTTKNNKNKKQSTMFIIINKTMLYNLTNESITQYFGDATYHCIPPTIRRYKLYVISGFNLKEKKIILCCYALIPDEKNETYNKLFDILKNNYKFNPKIFTIDFCRASTKAIKNNFPSCIIIKCFFHWVKALWGNMKKNGYTDLKNIAQTKIVLFNVKVLAFIDPKLIKKYYNLIINEFGNEYEKFFKYFEKNWIKKKKLGKYTPIFNYYANIKGPDFDKKFLFLSNNISESINHILNSFFKNNYPSFSDWSNSILQTLELFENKKDEIKRNNYTSEMLIFYINNLNKKDNNIRLLDKIELKKLEQIHENNINNLSDNSISRLLNLDLSIDENNNLNCQNDNKINSDINNLNCDDLILSEDDDLNSLNEDLNKLNLDENKDFNFYLM